MATHLRQSSKKLLILAASFLLFCSVVFLARHKKHAQTVETNPSVFIGKPAPDFALQDLHGKRFLLSSLRGKAVLLNFWATWCGPCKIETPWLSELRDKYASQGFEVVGVSTEGEALKPGDRAGHVRQQAAIDDFLQLTQPSYTILLDGDSISQLYGGLNALPTTFYLNKDGIVVAAETGIRSESEIEANIHTALGR